MITVQCKKGQITVSGHAGYAEKGHDIVCAAVADFDAKTSGMKQLKNNASMSEKYAA